MKTSEDFNVKFVNFIIIAVLLFLLFNAMSCEDDDCYTDMHVVELKSWECFQSRGLDCGDIDFPTEEEWLDQYGRVWKVRCEYANMTIGKFHYKPVK
jgi:hypothetical protein